MLILADADRLGFDLHQLCQRVLQAAGDGNRAAQAHIQIGKLPRRQFAGGIDRGARLGHDHLHRLFARQMGQEVGHHLLRLAAGGAISNSDQLHPMPRDQLRDGNLSAAQVVLGLERIDRIGAQNLARGIDHRHLHPRPNAGIQPHGRLAARRGRQQQILEIAGKDMDRLGLGALPHLAHQIQRQTGFQLHPPGPGRGLAQPGVARAATGRLQLGAAGTLAGAVTARRVGIDLQIHGQEALLLAAQHGQNPVARRRLPGLGMGEIVRELGALGLLPLDHLGRNPPRLFHMPA